MDAAGNVDGIPRAGPFVDTQAPVTTVTGVPSGLTRDSTPTFSLGGTGASSFKCSVDGGAYNACSAKFTTASLGDGAHTLGVKASDQAGNEDATPATRSFRVDTTPPRVRIRPAKPRASESGVIKLRVSCPVTEYAQCRGTLVLLKKKSKKSKRYRAARGKTVTVKLQLTDAALAQLQADGVLPVTASAASSDLLGNRRMVKRKLRVRA